MPKHSEKKASMMEKRNAAIKKDFQNLVKDGSRRTDWALAQLSEKYFLTADYIQALIRKN